MKSLQLSKKEIDRLQEYGLKPLGLTLTFDELWNIQDQNICNLFEVLNRKMRNLYDFTPHLEIM